MLRKFNQSTGSVGRKFEISTIGAAVAFLLLAVSPQSASAASNNWQHLVAQGEEDINRQDVSEAENHFRQALKTVEQTSHSIDDAVKCQNKLANALALQNKTADALVLYKKSLSQLERKYGRQNAHESSTILALGSVYESLGDHALAASMYHRAFAINHHSFSPYNPAIASSLPNLRRVAPHPQQTQAALRGGVGLNAMSLEASHSLVNGVVKSASNDRLTKMDSTDEDLLSDFQKQMLHFSNNTNAYATKFRNATVQETALKPSRKM